MAGEDTDHTRLWRHLAPTRRFAVPSRYPKMKPLLLFVVVPLVLVTIIDLLARRIRKSARRPATVAGSSGPPAEIDVAPRVSESASTLQRDPELLAAKALQAIARILELTTKITAVDAERAAHAGIPALTPPPGRIQLWA